MYIKIHIKTKFIKKKTKIHTYIVIPGPLQVLNKYLSLLSITLLFILGNFKSIIFFFQIKESKHYFFKPSNSNQEPGLCRTFGWPYQGNRYIIYCFYSFNFCFCISSFLEIAHSSFFSPRNKLYFYFSIVIGSKILEHNRHVYVLVIT